MLCFSKFCRVCLSKNNTLVNVDHLAFDNVSYLNKLQFMSPTLVEKQCNYMLLWICDKCQTQLNSAYKFLQHSLTSVSLLEGYYLQLTNTNTEQNVCNSLIEKSIENTIKKEECLEDISEIQDQQYFSESLITVKNELSPVDLETEIKFKNSTFETIYLKEFEFNFTADDETNKNGSEFTECSPNLTKNIPENQVAESNDQNNVTSCDDFNERSVNSSKLVASNRSIKSERSQNSTNLNRNKSGVNKEKTFECNICKKKFSHAGYLKKHELFHTGQLPYKCKMCSKKFNFPSNLKMHEMSHTGERPYKCNICPKTFIQSSSWRTHQMTHSGEQPFKCNMCPKKFNDSSHLKRHERTHTGERPYKCNMCLKKYKDSCDLKRHERTHTGERPYKCNMCPKTFKQSSSLKLHERIHSGVLPYKCNMCPKKFSDPSNMKKHERTHNEKRAL